MIEVEGDIFSANNNIKKSKYIICPYSKENIRLIISDDKITLYECINKHLYKNLSSKILCGNCSIAKNKTYENIFNIYYHVN